MDSLAGQEGGWHPNLFTIVGATDSKGIIVKAVVRIQFLVQLLATGS